MERCDPTGSNILCNMKFYKYGIPLGFIYPLWTVFLAKFIPLVLNWPSWSGFLEIFRPFGIGSLWNQTLKGSNIYKGIIGWKGTTPTGSNILCCTRFYKYLIPSGFICPLWSVFLETFISLGLDRYETRPWKGPIFIKDNRSERCDPYGVEYSTLHTVL